MPAPPPPPPPPPPMPGRGAGGPPPPPMPGRAPGGKPPSGAGRGALLTDINKGMKLKKTTVVNDRSAPQVGKVSDGPSAPPIGGAPPVPGMNRAPPPPSGLAPPVPGNRARSNSDTGGDGGGIVSAAPQLGGLFAGGMPKLRKAGGVKTGAESSSPYLSDPESSRGSAPPPPRGAAPKPPGAPPGAPPPLPTARPPPNPSVAALRNNLRPASVTSTHSMYEIGSKPKPPLPGKKPPIPPPSSRKPSGIAPPPPASPARAPPVPGSAPPAPPPPPPSHTPSAPPPPPPSSVPSAPPPPPPPSAPRAPSRSIAPPPPPPNRQSSEDDDNDDEYDPYRYTNAPPRPPSAPAPPAPKAPTNGQTSIAEQAARNAFGRSSPAAPPPPPPGSPPPSTPSVHAPPPPPSSPPSRPATQTPLRSMLDPSSYTLSNGGSGAIGGSTSAGAGSSQRGKIVPIHDLRWRFVDEAQFPKPREFTGGAKRYRAGRGSSVPLDLSAYE